MVTLQRVYSVIWLLSLAFFLTGIFVNEKFILTSLFLVLMLTGMNLVFFEFLRKKPLKEREEKKLDFSEIEKKIEETRDQLEKFNKKFYELKEEFYKFGLEREKKYRDVVRKVLDLDSKLNEKYKLLGEAIVELNKKIKKDY